MSALGRVHCTLYFVLMDEFETPTKEPDLSPRIRSVLDSFSSSVSREYWWYGSLSVNDSFGLDASAFTSHGSQVIAVAKALAAKAVTGSLAPVAEPVAGGSHDSPFFKAKKFRSKAWEPQQSSEKSGAKADEKRKKREVASEILSRMDTNCRERFMPGVHKDLTKEQAEAVLLRALENGVGVGHLRSAKSAIDRFISWSRTYFGGRASAAVMAMFLFSTMVDDGDSGHVSQSLRAGLVYAVDTLKFPWVLPKSVLTIAKPPKGTPRQAPSASVRLVHHFWQCAASEEYSMPLRGASAAFYVMCVCALRGVDAQRSRIDDKILGGGTDLKYFTAFAYDSKSRESMPWACPLQAFGGDVAWLDALFFIWKEGNDFMFPSLPRGTSLSDATGFLEFPASAYFILKYLREILQLPSVSLSGEEAKLLRRHSMRHWIANAIRILKFPPADAFAGGRWKEMGTMPLRYSQETKFVTAVDLIRRVLLKCEQALLRVKPADWPVFGGWEFLMEGAGTPSVNLEEMPEPDSDEEGGESDKDEPPPEVSAPVVRAAAKQPKVLPPGWQKSVTVTPSGRSISHFYGPGEVYRRSLKQAWIVYAGSQEVPESTSCERPVLHSRIKVWFQADDAFYTAKIIELVDGSEFVVKVLYDVDNEEKVHDLSKEVWEYDGDVDVASPEVEAAPVAEQPVGGDGVECETADGESSQAAQPAPAWLRQLDMKFADGSPSFFSPAEGSRRQKRGDPAL